MIASRQFIAMCAIVMVAVVSAAELRGGAHEETRELGEGVPVDLAIGLSFDICRGAPFFDFIPCFFSNFFSFLLGNGPVEIVAIEK